jgi:hypothetical protein
MTNLKMHKDIYVHIVTFIELKTSTTSLHGLACLPKSPGGQGLPGSTR